MENGTHYRTCHLCEAMCGVAIELKDGRIASIKGDENDPLSRDISARRRLRCKTCTRIRTA